MSETIETLYQPSAVPPPAPETAPAPAGQTPPPGEAPAPARPEAARDLAALVEGGSHAAPVAGQARVEQTSSNQGSFIDTSQMRQVGTVVVGDDRASLRQNSEETVTSTRELLDHPSGVPVSADIPVSVPSRAAQDSIPLTELLRQVQAGRFETVRLENGQREIREISGPDAMPTAVSSPQPDPARRFVLNVFDVHDMGEGGTPSQILVLDGKEQQVGLPISLPEGDSQYAVDLPPGDYTFRALAGTRADPSAPDARDNFRLEVFDGGTVPETSP